MLPTYFQEDGQEVSPLDVGRTLKVYLEATSSVRISDFLFVIPNGIRKGYKAPSRIIATWLVKTIAMAYKNEGLAHPERITAHSTRSVLTSWAASSGISPEVICKAATWSSMHTFVSLFRIDPAMLTTAKFGKTITSVGGGHN